MIRKSYSCEAKICFLDIHNSFEREKTAFEQIKICYFVKTERNFSFCPKNLKQFDFITVMILFDDIQQSYFLLFFSSQIKRKKNIIVLLTTLPLYVCFLYF